MAFLAAIPAVLGAIGSGISSAVGAVGGVGNAIGLLGTGVSAVGTIAAGQQAQQAASARARQADMQAQESRAASQRQALEEKRKGDLVQSRLQAVAAASGAGADDPTVLKLGEDIAGRTEYSSLMSMYTGENRARGLEDEADAERVAGRSNRIGSYFSAAGTLARGAGSIYGRYNQPASYG